MIKLLIKYITISYQILKSLVNLITLFFSYIKTFVNKTLYFINYFKSLFISWVNLVFCIFLEGLIEIIVGVFYYFGIALSICVGAIVEALLGFMFWIIDNFEKSGYIGIFNILFIFNLNLLAWVFTNTEINFVNFLVISSTWTNVLFWLWLFINLIYIFNNPYWKFPAMLILCIEYYIEITYFLLIYFNETEKVPTRSYNFTTRLKLTNNRNLGKRLYSTSTNTSVDLFSSSENSKINPWYITGFADGEGSFYFSLAKAERKTDTDIWPVTLGFELPALDNPSNRLQLEQIQKFFGVGRIEVTKSRENQKPMLRYVVSSLKDCLVIRDHFIKYPLLTTKLVHFKLWSSVLDLKIQKDHLTIEGLLKIVALKIHSPKGLSLKLQEAFPNYINFITEKPSYDPNFSNLNYNWLAGMINADGSFSASLANSPNSKHGLVCNTRIMLTQHSDNKLVLTKIKEFLGFGSVYEGKKNGNYYDYKITGLKETNLFIENFNSAQLLGAKSLDYQDFCKIIQMKNSKLHLTKEGLKEIDNLIKKMNNTRTLFENLNIEESNS